MSAGPTTSARPCTSGTGRHLQLVFSAPAPTTRLSDDTSDTDPSDGRPRSGASSGSRSGASWSGIASASGCASSVTASILSPPARALRRDVLTAGLARGVPVDGHAVTVILAAKLSCHVVPVHLFTEDMIWQLVWVDVFTWCATRRLPVPDRLAETLWDILNHLEEAGGFHEESDVVDLLRSPLMSSAGLSADGSARHPTGRRNA